jgi:transposase
MSEPAENLSNDPAVLKAMIAELQAENAKISATLRVHDQLVQALRLRTAKLQKLAFGKSSEKIEREIEQLELALEDLLVAVAEDDDADIDEGLDEPSPEEPSAPALRRRPRVSDGTLRERRELDPGTCCPDCGGDLRVVGEDVSELLDMIAAQMKVVKIARIKKSCRRCEKMVQEPAPSRPIPGSMAGPNLLAHILVSKFDDHLPLYRQHEIFARMGADIPESTLVGWCGRAMKTLSPLIERIRPTSWAAICCTLTTRRSGYWTDPFATRGLAKGSGKAGFGPMCAIKGLGRGCLRRGLSIGSRRIGKKSTS